MSSYAPMTGGGGRRYENAANPYTEQESQYGYGQQNTYESEEPGNGRAGYNPYQSYSPAPNPPRQPAPPQSDYNNRQNYSNVQSNNYRPSANEDPSPPGQAGMEMTNMKRSPKYELYNTNPRAMIDDCVQIIKEIKQLEDVQIYGPPGGPLGELANLHNMALNDTDADRFNKQISDKGAELLHVLTELSNRTIEIRKHPRSNDTNNTSQVGRAKTAAMDAIQKYHRFDNDFQKKLFAQSERQYRIVNPTATDEEVKVAVENATDPRFYKVTLQQSTRKGEARSALSAVQNRHDAIQKIAREMALLAELFSRVEAAVAEQEPKFERIEHQTEDTKDNVEKGKVHLEEGEKKARAARKKRWICLGITILIILIIAAVIAIAVVVTNNKKN